MRILAIRGKNLTSLEGEFELDLENGPLGEAGLFAISGPTGAGKSTLLDALCVALYNETPRLNNHGGVQVGASDGTLRGTGANDPRNLLRDGTSEGFAEVDFTGSDARRWRSRWSVRRARGKIDGTLQASDLVLREIDGAAVGDGLRDTLEKIQKIIGLDFDQFKRAVLLAQGDFAAFLKSKGEDRASLLEQMTGTHIYGLLSMAAHQRASTEKAKLEALTTRLADAQPADADTRAAFESAATQATAAREAAKHAADRCTSAVGWHVEAERRNIELGAATVEHERVVGVRRMLDDAQDELTRSEAAEPHRAAVVAMDAAASSALSAAEDAAKMLSEANASEAEAKEATTRGAAARATREHAERSRADASPALQQARDADVRLTMLLEQATTAAAASQHAARAADEAKRVADGKFVKLQAVDATLTDLESWVTEHAPTKPLFDAWAGIQLHLDVVAAQGARAAAATAAAQGLEGAATRAGASYDAATAAQAMTDTAAEAARSAAEQAAQAAQAHETGTDRTAARAQLVARVDALRRCRELLVESTRLGGELARDREAHAVAAAQVVEAKASETNATTTRADRIARLAEAKEAYRAAQAAADLTEHRQHLVEHTPCPLCGSEEHPWAVEAPLAGLVGGLATRVASIEREIDTLTAQIAGASTLAETKHAEARALEARIGEHAGRHDHLAREWESVRVEPLPVALTASDLPSASAIGEASARDAERNLQDLDAQEAEAKRLRGDHVRALQAAQLAAELAARSATEAQAKRDARDQAARALLENTAVQTDVNERVNAALDAAAPTFSERAGWRQTATSAPNSFREACAREVEAWSKALQDRDCERERRVKLHQEHSDAALLQQQRVLDGGEKELAATAAQQTSAAARDVRAALLNNEDANTVERRLDGAVSDARAKDAAATSDATLASEKAVARRAAANAKALERDQRNEDHLKARGLVDQALTALGLDEVGLRDRLSRDAAWRSRTRQQIGDADRTVIQFEASVRAKRDAATEHRDRGAPAEDRATLEAQLPTLKAEVVLADDVWTEARARLLQDDDRCARAAEILPQLEAQNVVLHRWSVINTLIGSANGKVFRVFAQSLTLNLLLAESNAQLKSLSPRYQLQRVPNTDMELQVVDLDMAEQVRPITSLSGGETFLVSLALALGLSALAATNTRIDSIFIDEGFGTLDSNTLEVAMATLEGLRAEGRTVGVISHVGGLAEKIGTWVAVEKVAPGRSRVKIEMG